MTFDEKHLRWLVYYKFKWYIHDASNNIISILIIVIRIRLVRNLFKTCQKINRSELLTHCFMVWIYRSHPLFQCFMEPLKKCQVEGHLMYAEPEDLFGNLDELCYVSLHYFYIIVFLSHFATFGVYINAWTLRSTQKVYIKRS